MLWQPLTWAECLRCSVLRLFPFLITIKKEDKNLSSELPYKRGELISWETYKMQRARCAFAKKIPSLARRCILIGFSSSKSRKLSKQTPQGRRRSDSDLWAPVAKESSPELCCSWLQPQWSRSLTHPEEKEAADNEWWCLPSPQLLNLPKCLPTGHAREGLLLWAPLVSTALVPNLK